MEQLSCKLVDYAAPKTQVDHTISGIALTYQHTEPFVSNLFSYVQQKEDLKNACDHPVCLCVFWCPDWLFAVMDLLFQMN